MMHDYMLLLPVICPVIGGLASAKVHTLKLRRLVVSTILLLQIGLIMPIMFMDTGTLQLIQLAPGVRLVLRADMLSRFFSMLIAVIWFFVAIFAYEYMNHESHRERFFCFYLLSNSNNSIY